MIKYEYGSPDADCVLIQMADDHDLSILESQVSHIKRLSDRDFRLIALKVENWNRDLSPWEAPPVFGKEGFGGRAADTLKEAAGLLENRKKKYYIGGYSLAGLFALWAAYQTDAFTGVAAASPSIWFPGFIEYMKENRIQTGRVYLSLGDREEKTRNRVMASVGARIRSGYEILHERGVHCTLQWNKGNHFQEADVRTAKAFAWVMGAEAAVLTNTIPAN